MDSGTVLVDIRPAARVPRGRVNLAAAPPTRHASGCRAAPCRVVVSPESLRACSCRRNAQGEPCCRWRIVTASPPGAPGQERILRHQRRHHFVYWIEGVPRQGLIIGPTCFLPCEERYLSRGHFCRVIDAPSCQSITLRLISRLELEARVTKRALAGLARIQPSEVPRARLSHMVLLLPHTLVEVEGRFRWGVLGKRPG